MKRLLHSSWRQLTQKKIKPSVAMWVSLSLAALFFFDAWLLDHLRLSESSSAQAFARFLSKWGDFYTGCFIVVAAVFFWGLLAKKKRLRTLALAMLLSGALAGLTASALRFFSGRPRPSAHLADGLYGPRLEQNKRGYWVPSYNYMSLPSAHAATAVGTATPLLILQPAIGLPVMAGAVLVGWSRFQLGRHNPSDIYLGFLIGGLFGIALGRAVRSLS